MRYAIFLSAILPAFAVAFGQATELVSVKFQHDNSITVIHSARLESEKILAAQYTNALGTLRLKAQSEGDLDKIKEILAETERFQIEHTTPTNTTSSADLKNLAASFMKRSREIEVREATDILKQAEQYDATLAALQKQLTQDGKIEQATAVQEERKTMAVSRDNEDARTLLSQAAAGKTPPAAAVAPAATKALPSWISPEVPRPGADGWITLFDGLRLHACTPSAAMIDSGRIRIENRVLIVDKGGIEFDVVASNAVMRSRMKKLSGRNIAMHVRKLSGGRAYMGYFSGGTRFGIGKFTPNFTDIKIGYSPRDQPDFFDMEFSAVGPELALKADGKFVILAHNKELVGEGRLFIYALDGATAFKRIEVKILDAGK